MTAKKIKWVNSHKNACYVVSFSLTRQLYNCSVGLTNVKAYLFLWLFSYLNKRFLLVKRPGLKQQDPSRQDYLWWWENNKTLESPWNFNGDVFTHLTISGTRTVQTSALVFKPRVQGVYEPQREKNICAARFDSKGKRCFSISNMYFKILET